MKAGSAAMFDLVLAAIAGDPRRAEAAQAIADALGRAAHQGRLAESVKLAALREPKRERGDYLAGMAFAAFCVEDGRRERSESSAWQALSTSALRGQGGLLALRFALGSRSSWCSMMEGFAEWVDVAISARQAEAIASAAGPVSDEKALGSMERRRCRL